MFPLLMLLTGSCSASAQGFDPRDPHSPLQLIRAITLADVHGRIDHMALDPRTNHLFVAELGNGSVDDVDLASGTVAGRISGLHEPQGVAWLPARQEIAVACGDGSVHFYRRSDRREVARVELGDDADNVRVDARNGNLVVGFGSGGLAVIDPSTHRVIRKMILPAHPEAFELLGGRVFVNVPDAHKLVIGDLDQARITGTLSDGAKFGNFPMAANSSSGRIAIAFRLPGTLEVIDARSNAAIFSAPICGNADDLYFRSGQIVVICGSGTVELIREGDEHDSVRVVTTKGARTGLLDPSGKRLFVAVPSRGGPAAIWELSFAS
jgi:hypothetical protein